MITWQPIETCPHDKIVLLTGDAGIITTPNFILLGYYNNRYRPPIDGQIRYLTINNDQLTDYGYVPTHWALMPNLPGKEMVKQNEWTKEDFMPRVDGKSFRCDCGGNVFKKGIINPNKYKCNSCGAAYISE